MLNTPRSSLLRRDIPRHRWAGRYKQREHLKRGLRVLAIKFRLAAYSQSSLSMRRVRVLYTTVEALRPAAAVLIFGQDCQESRLHVN